MQKYIGRPVSNNASPRESWHYIQDGYFAVCMCVRPVTQMGSSLAGLIGHDKLVGYKAYSHCEACLGYGSQPIPMCEVR